MNPQTKQQQSSVEVEPGTGERRRRCRHQQHHGMGHGHGECCHGEGNKQSLGCKKRRKRIFESGDLRFVILNVLAQQPSHGYEIIVAIGDMVGGDYQPSPGTIYPTLSLLVDMGYAEQSQEDGSRKQYTLTSEGHAFLAAHQDDVQRITKHLSHLRYKAKARRDPVIQTAMDELKSVVISAMEHDGDNEEKKSAIAQVISQAALDIAKIVDEHAEYTAATPDVQK